MTSVALSVLVMCQLFCSVPLTGVCGYGVDPYGQFWPPKTDHMSPLHFLLIIACFIFVFSRSSSGDVKGLLGTFSRCDHMNRVQVKGYGGVSTVQHL